MTSKPYRDILVWGMLALVLSVSGCQSAMKPTKWNWRGHGYGEDENSLTGNLRPPADERSMSGLDARARDIERNLGVR